MNESNTSDLLGLWKDRALRKFRKNKELDMYMERKNREELEEIEPNISIVDECDLDLEAIWAAEEAARNFGTSWYTGPDDRD